MVNQQLIDYIKSEEAQGYTSQQIYSYLIQSGYDQNEVYQAVLFAEQQGHINPSPVQVVKTSFPTIIIISFAALILIILGVFFFIARSPEPVCGNGVIEAGEDYDTCCADAGCPSSEECMDDICMPEESLSTESAEDISAGISEDNPELLEPDLEESTAEDEEIQDQSQDIPESPAQNLSEDSDALPEDSSVPSDDIPDEELSDPIKIECGDDIWCYHDMTVEEGNYSACFKINDYWDDTDQGVVGSCISNIAFDLEDCSLCDLVVKQDMHDLCISDVCEASPDDEADSDGFY
ncbi:MAG: hypothetical protein KKE20_01135 [Nanoarchaeota archaeon]|nr:hypothetical protein [Nanoarchaeota archaeon]